jgi:hypothetical protein
MMQINLSDFDGKYAGLENKGSMIDLTRILSRPTIYKEISLYHAGLTAGRERAIEECAKVCDDLNRGILRNSQGEEWVYVRCAAAIRAKLREA